MYMQMRGTRLFELFGTPVFAQGSYLLILLFLNWRLIAADRLAEAGVAVFAITLSLLVHEFGHVFAAKTNGFRSVVVLGGMGAFTVPGGRSKGWREIWLSVAGPLFGLVLWAVCWFIFMPPGAAVMGHRLDVESMFFPAVAAGHGEMGPQAWGPLLVHLWVTMCWINLWWSLLNLLPIFPLDGGHVLHESLRMNMRADEAEKISAWVGLVLAGGLCIWCYVELHRLLPALIAGFLAFQNWGRLQDRR